MDAEDEKSEPGIGKHTSEASAQQSQPAGPSPGGTDMPVAPLELEPFGGEEDWHRPPAAIQRLRKRLERGGGLRGIRLAELALRAGIIVPPPPAETHGPGGLEAALWMEMARENAVLRREAEKLAERQETLSRRIQRAKARLRELRLKVARRRLGLEDKDLLDLPSAPTWQELVRQRLKRAADPGEQASGEDDDDRTRDTEPK